MPMPPERLSDWSEVMPASGARSPLSRSHPESDLTLSGPMIATYIVNAIKKEAKKTELATYE